LGEVLRHFFAGPVPERMLTANPDIADCVRHFGSLEKGKRAEFCRDKAASGAKGRKRLLCCGRSLFCVVHGFVTGLSVAELLPMCIIYRITVINDTPILLPKRTTLLNNALRDSYFRRKEHECGVTLL
jgi:hypothetical protein